MQHNITAPIVQCDQWYKQIILSPLGHVAAHAPLAGDDKLFQSTLRTLYRQQYVYTLYKNLLHHTLRNVLYI